jgi:hypothetical protein
MAPPRALTTTRLLGTQQRKGKGVERKTQAKPMGQPMKTQNPAHPVQPTHPVPPTHPVRPTHPVKPPRAVTPAHPVQPAQPGPGPKKRKSPMVVDVPRKKVKFSRPPPPRPKSPASTSKNITTSDSDEEPSPSTIVSRPPSSSQPRQRRPRLDPEPSGVLYSPRCDRCHHADFLCQQPTTGGSCVLCRKRKVKCRYASRRKPGQAWPKNIPHPGKY